MRQLADAKARLALLTRTPALLAVGYFGLALTLMIVLQQGRSGERHGWPTWTPIAPTDPVSGPPSLTFVFNVRDCPDSRRLISHWNQLHQAGRLSVRGLLLDGPADRASLARLLDVFEIRFPVTTRSDEVGRGVRAMLALGYRRTPVAIVTDRHGRPRLILPPSHDAQARSARIGLLETTLTILEQEGRDERSEHRGPA